MAPNPLSKPILPKELQKLLSSAQNADQAFQKQSEDLLQRLLQFFLSLFFGFSALPEGQSFIDAKPVTMDQFNQAAKYLELDKVITDPQEKQKIIDTMNQAMESFNKGDIHNAITHAKTLAQTFLKHADQVSQKHPVLGRIAKPLAKEFIKWADKALAKNQDKDSSKNSSTESSYDSPSPKPSGRVSTKEDLEKAQAAEGSVNKADAIGGPKPGVNPRAPVRSLNSADKNPKSHTPR